MEHRRPLRGQRLHVLETVRFLEGEGDAVAKALDRVAPDAVALDVTPERVNELTAHVKHGTGVRVGRLDEVWTNLAVASGAGPVEPFGEHAAAVRWALDAGVPVVALDRRGKDLRSGQQSRLESSLAGEPLDARDLMEAAMALRGRMYELGYLDVLEKNEETMADVLWEVLEEGIDDAPVGTVAAVISYPASEEVAIRVREREELAQAAERIAAADEG